MFKEDKLCSIILKEVLRIRVAEISVVIVFLGLVYLDLANSSAASSGAAIIASTPASRALPGLTSTNQTSGQEELKGTKENATSPYYISQYHISINSIDSPENILPAVFFPTNITIDEGNLQLFGLTTVQVYANWYRPHLPP